MWVEQAQQPVAQVNWRREWLWLYGFVHPQSGETKRVESVAESPDRVLWQAFPRPYVNTKLFNRVLADFAHEFGAGNRLAHHPDNGSSRLALRCEQVEAPEGLHKRVYALTRTRVTTAASACDL